MWTIDRLEGDLAVLEVAEGKTVTVPKTALPEGAEEGDVLCITIDREKTAAREAEIKALMADVFAD